MPYTQRTDQVANIAVNVLLDGGAEGGTEPWTIRATGDFDGSDFTEAGTGDAAAGTLTGPFYDGRDYEITFEAVAGYDLPVPSTVTITASGSLQTFIGDYTASVPTQGDITVTPSEATATWTLTGPGYDSGSQTGTQTLTDLDYGEYTATFDDNLLGFTSPAPDVGLLDSPVFTTGNFR